MERALMVETYQPPQRARHFGLNALASQNNRMQASRLARSPIARSSTSRQCGDLVFSTAVKVATGADLPFAANTVSAADDLRILVSVRTNGGGGADAKPHRADRTVAPILRRPADGVTTSRKADRLTNQRSRHARRCWRGGISLDLHPRAFGPCQCAQTGMSKANMCCHQIDDRPSYEIYS